MIVYWTELADITYGEELAYISNKWSDKEVVDFMSIVGQFIKRLEKGILVGKILNTTNSRSFVISKQTTLFFDVYEDKSRINLLLFWNNKRDPEELRKLLNNLE